MKEQVIKKKSYVRPLIEVTYVGLEHQLLAGSPVVTPKPEVVPPWRSRRWRIGRRKAFRSLGYLG